MQPLMVTTSRRGGRRSRRRLVVDGLAVDSAAGPALVTALAVGPLGEPPPRRWHGVSASLERRAAEKGTRELPTRIGLAGPGPAARGAWPAPASRGPATNRLTAPSPRRVDRAATASAAPTTGSTASDGTTASTTPSTGARFDSGTPVTTAAPATTARRGPVRARTRRHGGSPTTRSRIGIHAPVTGAATHSPDELDIGKDIYWDLAESARPTLRAGRSGRVPRRRVQSAARRAGVPADGRGRGHALLGGGGADQITKCAQYANENGIPYLSAGVNESGLSDLGSTYRPCSRMPSAPLIMAQLQSGGITEVGLVVSDTPSFDDAFAALKLPPPATQGDDRLPETRIKEDRRRARAALRRTGVEELRRRR